MYKKNCIVYAFFSPKILTTDKLCVVLFGTLAVCFKTMKVCIKLTLT